VQLCLQEIVVVVVVVVKVVAMSEIGRGGAAQTALSCKLDGDPRGGIHSNLEIGESRPQRTLLSRG
jgi:hypothetical protein